MKATQTLPPTYHSIGTLDISKDRRMMVILNVIGVLLLAASGWLFFAAAAALRSKADLFAAFQTLETLSQNNVFLAIIILLALMAVFIIVHEAIHGICFWLFTRSRPLFALRLGYAYAAAPDWYLPSGQYLVTALAPFVVISLVSLLLLAAAPPSWLLPVWFVATANASGAVGDLLVAAWLLRQPPTCLAQDRGDAVTLFVAHE